MSGSIGATVTEKPFDVLRARAFLMIGGIFGWHRLYLRQIPEAFIYFSTWGVFLLGVFYDSFFINSQVQEYNDRIDDGNPAEGKASGNGKTVRFLLPQTAALVRFSFSRFVYSILYACYLGMFVAGTGNLLLGISPSEHFPLMTIVAGAVSFGIFLVGNSGGQSRSAAPIWMSTFTILTVALKVFDLSIWRAVFSSSIAGTLIGNRGAKKICPRDRSFRYKHYVFWCSLWMFCICLCIAGSGRQFLEKRVTFHSNEARVSSTFAKLLYDRYENPAKVYRFFEMDSLSIIYEKPAISKRKMANKSLQWHDDLWDWWVESVSPTWIDQAFTFTIDLFKAEARARKGKLVHEPLKWAAWRLYLRWVFDLSASAKDEQYETACAGWIRKEKLSKNAGKYDVKQVLSIRRACDVATS
ncbi:unnamed protein product, partial [Mesorhabditis belari]|uniref:TM2 domain-containing protein n=1 Tax=Mesorhabditis belari TaxID=2138241 RepID=A0AAF3ED37_9BILA